MNRTLMIVASAIVAVSTTISPAAQAKGGGGGHHSGGGMGMKFSSGPSHQEHRHFRVFRRDTVVTPIYSAEESRARRLKSAVAPASRAPIIKYADGKGRVYDVGSRAWCDGNKHCWSGPLAWTFKDGSWFYGGSRWYEADGGWRTDTAEGPTVIDCETIPGFATLKPTTELEIARTEPESTGPLPKDTSAAPVAVNASSPSAAGTKPTECKKYFPSIGSMVSVPCEG
jgi:hypothetical protein